MGQIIGGAAKPKRCNLNKLSQLGTPAAGEHILVSSDNSMNAAGQGNFDCYIVGDRTTAATELELRYITGSDKLKLTELLSLEVQSGTNLLDPDKYSNGVLLRSAEPETNPSWSTSDFIPVSPNTLYSFVGINNSGGQRSASFVTWWAADKSYISLNESVWNETSPENAAYVRLCTYNARQDYTKLALTGVFEGRANFEPYVSTKSLAYHPTTSYEDMDDDGLVTKKDLENLTETGFNAVEPDGSNEDKYVNHSSGVIENNQNYHYFDYNVSSGDILLLSLPSAGSAVAVLAMYSGGTYIKKYSMNYGGSFVTIIPEEISMIRISLLKTETYSIRKSSLIHFKDNDSSKGLSLRHIGVYYDIYEGNDSIRVLDGSTSRNKNLCFQNVVKNGISYDASDDITPMHILNTTLGGNHAQPITQATITAHGFVDSDLGTAWTHSNGDVYYLVLIVDENTASFLSANKGTQSAPIFQQMPVGTIVRNGNTKTISAVASSQMWSGIKNESYNIIVDGITIENAVEEVYGDVIDFVESYDIMNPASILENLVANAGNNVNGVYDGDVAVHADITYRFLRGLNRIVMTNYIVVQDEIKFADMMFSQKTGSTTAKYYTPNNTAFPVPAVFSSEETTFISESNTIKDTGVPCNRVLQYYENENFAFAVGILTDIGVGKNIRNYTDEYFELRGSTKKIYPLPVKSSKVGNTLQSGDMFTALMYYAIADIGTEFRQSLYHFNLNGEVYVFVDYSGSMVDKVSISDTLNGRRIKVIEASNAELINMKGNSEPYEQNNIYNGGFYVKANYVVGETCYIVVKLSE